MTKWRLDHGQIEVVDDAIAEILRQKTPAERVAMIFAANRTMRMMIAAVLRADHPDWTEDQIKCAVAKRMSRGAI
jgi:hypothetical protein